MIRLDFDLPDLDAAADLVDVLQNAAGVADRRNRQERAALWRRLAASITDGIDTLDQLYTHPE
ncbi:hypothetical protein [Streptacidiphilus rugosus]|uniref:hypothetical protein n=1 Tax=Streptacidiphilus rugosus TaxID=405783 RepID=UPI00055A0BE5|nr:hypothetical protein [Streptacidiphilus rugosus]